MTKRLVPSGICHCGSDMAGHPVWDNHAPVEMMLPPTTADDMETLRLALLRLFVVAWYRPFIRPILRRLP